MIKCPYCAEEIQEEAVFCRHCRRSLVESPAQRKPWNPFWLALAFGFAGAATWFVRSQKWIDFPRYGFSGFLNEPVLGSITSFLVWGLAASAAVWVWRVVIRRSPGARPSIRETGCVSGLIFFTLIVFFAILVTVNIDTRALVVQVTQSPTPQQPTRASPPATATLPQETRAATQPAPPTPTLTPVPTLKSQISQTRLREMVALGYIANTAGEYFAVDDFAGSFAQIDRHKVYALPQAPVNFIIRAEASWESASETPNLHTAGCGFAFHAQENSHYTAYLGMDGTARLQRIENNQVLGTWWKFYKALLIPADAAELLLVVENNRFVFLVDGKKMLDIVDDKLPAGSLGFSIHSGTNKGFGTRCVMQNVEVIELP